MSEEVKNEVAAAEAGAATAEAEGAKKRPGKSIPAGIAFIRSTFNNTQVSIADARGGVISWSSAGKAGFKGSRKSTAFAATMVAQDAARTAFAKGMHECEVRMQGAGAGRESAVRAIQAAGIRVTQITDTTPVPHNGCRARKRSREKEIKRSNPPGQHGAKRKRKLSEYGQQLLEKQKAKYIYGMREGQFRLFFERAKAKQGKTGDILLQMCESRLDNVVYRLGIAPTRAAARQLVTHKHIVVDGKVLNVPSYIVQPGQTVGVREKNRQMIAITDSLAHRKVTGAWMTWDDATMTGTFVQVPERSEIPENINEQAIVELYSR